MNSFKLNQWVGMATIASFCALIPMTYVYPREGNMEEVVVTGSYLE